jgi:uncharacterized metal-binding protein YceD (DUF177 family)
LKLVNQYIIPFKGLKEGEHRYDFEIGEAFFEEFSSFEIKTGLLIVHVLLHKKSNFLKLEISLNGKLEIQCDRCLEYFSFSVEHRGDLFVKFKEEAEEPDDQVIYLHPNDDLLDLTQYFIDSVGLSIPIQKVHPDNDDGSSGCNQEMLDRLDEHSHKESSKDEDDIDPRWAKLKDLLNEGNKN